MSSGVFSFADSQRMNRSKAHTVHHSRGRAELACPATQLVNYLFGRRSVRSLKSPPFLLQPCSSLSRPMTTSRSSSLSVSLSSLSTSDPGLLDERDERMMGATGPIPRFVALLSPILLLPVTHHDRRVQRQDQLVSAGI